MNRPFAEKDPVTEKPVPLPNRLRRKNGVWEAKREGGDWYPAESRWGQGKFSDEVNWPVEEGNWQKIPVEEAAERLARSGQYPSEMLVFRKLESMKEPQWKMRAFDRKIKEVIYKEDLPEGFDPDRYFFGDYDVLPNGEIIVLNNRTWTVSNSVPLDETIEVPIYWASRKEIKRLSYQSDAIDGGTRIEARNPGNGPEFVNLPSQR